MRDSSTNDFHDFNDVLEVRNGSLYWRLGVPRVGGKLTGQAVKEDGYRRVHLGGMDYYQHRVIWLLHYGEFPEGSLHHINENRTDNRIINLTENGEGTRGLRVVKQKNNKSGTSGVFQLKSGVWCASIGGEKEGGKKEYFTEKKDAVKWRIREMEARQDRYKMHLYKEGQK